MDPEVPGGLGENTVLDRADGESPTVHRLHFAFSDWLRGDLLMSHPVYLVTEPLATELASSGLSGLALSQSLEVSGDGLWEQLHPQRDPPEVWWLRINGEPSRDDFGLTEDASLIVSARALRLLRRHRLDRARVTRVD